MPEVLEVMPAGVAEVMRALTRHGRLASRDLVQDHGMPGTAVTRATAWLRSRGLLTDTEPVSQGQGRPLVPFAPGNGIAFLGIQVVDHDGQPVELVAVLADVGGRLLPDAPVSRIALSDGDRSDPDILVARIAASIGGLCTSSRKKFGLVVAGAGVAVGGHVNEGTVRRAPGLAWPIPGHEITNEDFDLQSALQEKLDMPIIVENDANCVALDIAMHSRTLVDSVVICLLADGIGGSLIEGGRLRRGANGMASEPGHLVVDYSSDALLCRCGHRGCLEAYAAPVQILHRLLQQLKNEPGSGIISMRTAAMRSMDDIKTLRVFQEAGSAVGRGLANIVNTVDPANVVVFAQPELVEPAMGSAASSWRTSVNEEIQRHAFSSARLTPVEFRSTTLGELEQLTANGAACLLVERLLEDLELRQVAAHAPASVLGPILALTGVA